MDYYSLYKIQMGGLVSRYVEPFLWDSNTVRKEVVETDLYNVSWQAIGIFRTRREEP